MTMLEKSNSSLAMPSLSDIYAPTRVDISEGMLVGPMSETARSTPGRKRRSKERVPEWIALVGRTAVRLWFNRQVLDRRDGLYYLSQVIQHLRDEYESKDRKIVWVPAPPSRLVNLAKTSQRPRRFFEVDMRQVRAWLGWRKREGFWLHGSDGLLHRSSTLMRSLLRRARDD